MDGALSGGACLGQATLPGLDAGQGIERRHRQMDVAALVCDLSGLGHSLTCRREFVLQHIGAAQRKQHDAAYALLLMVEQCQRALGQLDRPRDVTHLYRRVGADGSNLAGERVYFFVRRAVGQQPFRAGQMWLDRCHLSGEQQRPCVQHAQARAVVHAGLGQRREPTQQGGQLAAHQHRQTMHFEQRLHARPIGGRHGIGHGRVHGALLLVPGAGATVQLWRPFGVRCFQTSAQQVGEQAVVTVPLALLVQGDQEQIGLLQRRQGGRAVVAAGEGVAQRTGEALQDGGLEQEGLYRWGLAPQYLLGQIVQHIAVAAGKGAHKAGHVVPALHRERCQLQPGDPAFGASFQRDHVAGRQVEVHHLVEKGRGLVGREAQVGLAQFSQLAAPAQTCQGQRRVGAGGKGQM